MQRRTTFWTAWLATFTANAASVITLTAIPWTAIRVIHLLFQLFYLWNLLTFVFSLLRPILSAKVAKWMLTFFALYLSFSLAHLNFSHAFSAFSELKSVFYCLLVVDNFTMSCMLLLKTSQAFVLKIRLCIFAFHQVLKIFKFYFFRQVLVNRRWKFHFWNASRMWACHSSYILNLTNCICVEAWKAKWMLACAHKNETFRRFLLKAETANLQSKLAEPFENFVFVVAGPLNHIL